MTDARELLEGMVGEWAGRYRVWLEPPAVHTECESVLHIEPLLGGRFISADYDWHSGGPAEHAESSVEGEPQSGSFMLGRSAGGQWQMAWVDSWHNGDSILFSTGGPEAKVTGVYAPGPEPWSWRTEFELREADHLVITAYNIAPDGKEEIATEGDYHRT